MKDTISNNKDFQFFVNTVYCKHVHIFYAADTNVTSGVAYKDM